MHLYSCLQTIISLQRKIIFFISIFLIFISFLADFCFSNTTFYYFQQALFWPLVAVLTLLLLMGIGKKSLALRFSRSSIILLFILGIGLFLRLYKIDLFRLYFDEAHTTLRSLVFLESGKSVVFYAGIPIAFFKGQTEALFPLLASLSAHLFKDPEMIVRFLSVVIGVVTVWLVYRFVKELSSRATALIAAFFLAIFPWHIVYSRVGVSAILTPCFGTLFFYLFAKAIRKQSHEYIYLASFVLGIAAFWTYTASQVFVALAIICYMMLASELFWLKPLDIINCILLFVIPLYPFLATWNQSSFIESQYYHSVFRSYDNNQIFLLSNMFYRIKDTLYLLFFAKAPFISFAPRLEGPIIQYFLLVPLVVGFFRIQKDKILSRIVAIWLLGGAFLSVAFIGRFIVDRFFICILPIIPVIFANGIVFKKNKKSILFIIIVAVVGIGLYTTHYFSYLSHPGNRHLSWFGMRELSSFFSRDSSFVRPDVKVVIDPNMVSVAYYFTFVDGKKYCDSKARCLDKFIVYWGGDIPKSEDIVFYCIWSSELRPDKKEKDQTEIPKLHLKATVPLYSAESAPLELKSIKGIELYNQFKKFYPEEKPIDLIYSFDGKKAIEIFKVNSSQM